MAVRLQKAIADAGLCSRRTAEAWIQVGRVAVNGKVVTVPGTQVDPAHDVIAVDGRTLAPAAVAEPAHEYWALNKPAGVVSTLADPQGRPTLDDLARRFTPARVFPVGRLDTNTTGLILLTNDGELANRLTHPRYEHEKEYHVRLAHPLPEAALARLRAGVLIDDQPTSPAVVDRLPARDAWLRIVLKEGRKRQIRRMVEAVGGRVTALERVRIGPLTLGDLRPGAARRLTADEVAVLRGWVGLTT